MSSNVMVLVEHAVEYEVVHVKRNIMAATTVEILRKILRRQYMNRLSIHGGVAALCQPSSRQDEVRGHGPDGP